MKHSQGDLCDWQSAPDLRNEVTWLLQSQCSSFEALWLRPAQIANHQDLEQYKGCLKWLSFGVICYTAIDNRNKGFVPAPSLLQLKKLFPIHSKSKLSCQKWHFRQSHLIISLTSWQALKQLPTCGWKAHQGARHSYWECSLCQVDIIFLELLGRMRSGGTREKAITMVQLLVKIPKGDLFSICFFLDTITNQLLHAEPVTEGSFEIIILP